MYTRIVNLWSNFRASFWFVPACLMVAASLMAFVLIAVDKSYATSVNALLPFLIMSPPSARSILSSIVAAMVSTTGVVFSITIVALSLSSSQFGSRLIRTYRKRKTTHYTLGIFVSTSLFCILVLASIREVDGIRFVPLASVTTGILLSVVCLGMLIYYIHDMSKAIEAPNVIQQSAVDLHDAIERLFPDSIGHDDDSGNSVSPTHFLPKRDPDFRVFANGVGYLQAVENETLMSIAMKYDLMIRLVIRPGDFVYEGVPIADAFSADSSSANNNNFHEGKDQETIVGEIRNSFIVGPERTHLQDLRHAFDEVVEIGVRALSPGVNDPFTAVNCVDRIQAALAFLKTRRIPEAGRLDEKKNLRVVARPIDFRECVQGSLKVIHAYCDGSPLVARRIELALTELGVTLAMLNDSTVD